MSAVCFGATKRRPLRQERWCRIQLVISYRLVPPRVYQKGLKRLRLAQRRVASRKKGSHRRRKAVVLLRKIHQHIFNQRNDHQHKLARMLVSQFGRIMEKRPLLAGLTFARAVPSGLY